MGWYVRQGVNVLLSWIVVEEGKIYQQINFIVFDQGQTEKNKEKSQASLMHISMIVELLWLKLLEK